MTELINTIEKNKLYPQIRIVCRQQGFLDFKKLVGRIRAQYADRRYPDKLGPSDSISYIAYDGGKQIGAAVGVIKSRSFSLRWLVVNPQCEGRDIGRRLVKVIQNTYPKITLTASAFGEEKDITPEQKEKRKKDLIDYYRKLGFESNDEVVTPNVPIHMTWQK